jgi:hypothetical protein
MVLPFISSAAECEAAAVPKALQIAGSSGFEHVSFESECQTGMNKVVNGSTYENELEILLSNLYSNIN